MIFWVVLKEKNGLGAKQPVFDFFFFFFCQYIFYKDGQIANRS